MGSHTEREPRARATFTYAAYLLIILGPLGLCFTDVQPGSGMWINFSVALGFVALAVLGLQFVLTTSFSRVTAPFPVDAVLRYHRQITLLAVGAAFGHPLILMLASQEFRPLLNVLRAPLYTKFGWLTVIALTLLVVTSIGRRMFRLSYPVWHAIHSLLGVVIVGAALTHAFGVNYYMAEPWVRIAWLVYASVFLWLAVWVRLIKPLRIGLHPWRVVSLWPEPGGAVTMSLQSATRQGRAFTFDAGQFAWVQPMRSSLGLGYRAFSISSSAVGTNGQVDFTMRADHAKKIHVGDRVYLDGPHGSFTLERNPGAGYVFLATGVGITPFLSMLATLADRQDARQCWLFLGNRHEHEITGIRQINRFSGRLSLDVVHVISQASRGWNGEEGHIDADVLFGYLPEHYRSLEFFICSRDEIASSLRRMLIRELEVPAAHVHVEQFRMV